MNLPYPTLKALHMALVTLSVLLFAARGLAVLAHARWPMHPAVRRTSVVVDTALLTAGLSLWWALGLGLSDTPAWLLTKLALLPVYVVLGSWALKRARSQHQRVVFLALALATVGHMVAVAVAHHPLGLWAAAVTEHGAAVGPQGLWGLWGL
jgi:uncharacterized membrane protein SirB2